MPIDAIRPRCGDNHMRLSQLFIWSLFVWLIVPYPYSVLWLLVSAYWTNTLQFAHQFASEFRSSNILRNGDR